MADDILRACDNTDQPSVLGTMDDFRSSIDMVNYIDQGAYGAVFKVVVGDHIKAMKAIAHRHIHNPKSDISRRRNQIQETTDIKMGCLLKPLMVYTNSLLVPDLFGAFDNETLLYLRKVVAESDDNDEEVLNGGNQVIVIIMPLLYDYTNELYNSRWRPRTVPYPSDIDRLDILFEIIMAIYTLNSHGITHGDIRNENIMFTSDDSIRQYDINGELYLVTYRYRPIIIDYGTTSINNQDQSVEEDYDLMLQTSYFSNLCDDNKRLMDRDNFKYLLLSATFHHMVSRKLLGGDKVTTFQPIKIE